MQQLHALATCNNSSFSLCSNTASSSRPRGDAVIIGATATDQVQELANQAQGKDSFAWGKHWYPLMLEADLDTSAPSAHTLLNINMVIWQDGQGKWGASEDKCPHRYIAG